MRIGINASFLRKPATGIGQVTVQSIYQLEKSLRSLQRSLQKKGSDLEIILYLEEEASVPAWFQKRVSLPFFWRRDDLLRKILWEKYLLPKQIKRDHCDIFFSLYQSATVTPQGIPHIMVVHDIIPKLFPAYLNNARKRKYQSFVERAIMKADKIFAVSSRTEKDLIQHLRVNPEKISVNYIDSDPIFRARVTKKKSAEVMKRYRLQPGYIYSGGGLEMRKNVEKVLQAYKFLVEKNKREKTLKHFPKLVISGKLMPQLAPLVTDVKKRVKELNLSTRVRVLDFVPQEHLPALYANASLFVFPSLYEGFGLPILEAMNQGTPVITSKSSSLPEIGRDAVLYCDPKNHEEIADIIKRVLMEKELRDTLVRRGKERAEAFSWEKFVKKFIDLLNEYA